MRRFLPCVKAFRVSTTNQSALTWAARIGFARRLIVALSRFLHLLMAAIG
jgi:hypothetical protein